MNEQEMLQNEVRKHLADVAGNAEKYRNFLNTMAKFHKYSIIEQFNLHDRAPDDAIAVASEDIWQKAFHTKLAGDAVSIPLLVPQENGQYALRYVYDVRDTAGFRSGDAILRNVLWNFTAEDEAAAKNVLGGTQRQSLDEAIHEKAVALVRQRRTKPEDFIVRSVEHVVRARLGLLQPQPPPIEDIPQNVHIAVILDAVHDASKDILDALGNAIRKAQQERAKKNKEADSNDRGRNPSHQFRRVGEYATELFTPSASKGMGTDDSRGNRRAVSEGLRGRDVRAVHPDDGGSLQAGRRDRTTEEGRRDEVDAGVQQRPGRGEGNSAVRSDAAVRGRIPVGSVSIDVPQELHAKFAEDIFTEIAHAREEGRITEAESRESYLSFVRELMSTQSIAQEERDALIGRAYYAIAVTYGGVPEQMASVQIQELSAQPIEVSPDNPIEPSLEMSIRDWYRGLHADDPSGDFLHDITFREFADALPMGSALYPYAGIDSSDVREALFAQLAELSGRSYDDILQTWADVPSAEMRQERTEAAIAEEPPIEVEAKESVAPIGNNDLPEETLEQKILSDVEATLETGSSITAEVAPTSEEGVRETGDAYTVDFSQIDLAADMETTAGKRAVFQRNLAAVQIVNNLDRDGRQPTEEELAVLHAYSGFGGISEVFDAHNTAWHREYEQAKQVMTAAEFASARASTLDAFYTPPEIVQAIYEGIHRAGFQSGNILDPSTGTGRFLRYMPDRMKEGSHRIGIELDLLSAKVARYASDGADIVNQGFEHTSFPQNSFDLAISNVPFGDYIITDKNYPKNYFVHDYFLKKMLDEVRPGGLVVAITSHGTMDKKDETLRRELARKGELIRAVRLPNKLFAGAGTDALSDLLIFRKREKELSADAPLPEWVHADRQETTDYRGGKYITSEYYMNHYFREHPEDVLGTLSVRSFAFGVTPHVEGHDGKALAEELSAVLGSLSEHTYQSAAQQLPPPKEEKAAEKNLPFGYYEKNGSIVYYSPQGEIQAQTFDKKSIAQVRLAMQIRDRMRAMYDAELQDCSDMDLIRHQAALREFYESYTSTYGYIFEDNKLRNHFSKDSSYPLLLSLEKEQFELRSDLQKLGAERAQYLSDQTRIARQLNVHLPASIKTAERFVLALRTDVDTLSAHPNKEVLILNGKTYQTPEEIGTAFAECARAIYDGQMKETPRGAYRGMKVSVVQKDRHGIEVILSGKSTTSFKIGVSTVEANASRLMEAPQRVAEKLASAESDLAHLH